MIRSYLICSDQCRQVERVEGKIVIVGHLIGTYSPKPIEQGTYCLLPFASCSMRRSWYDRESGAVDFNNETAATYHAGPSTVPGANAKRKLLVDN